VFRPLLGRGLLDSVHSDTKSARICDLIACLRQNSISNSPSSTDHLTMRPLASRLQMISPKGNEDVTTIL
jgi:hypothetical protein